MNTEDFKPFPYIDYETSFEECFDSQKNQSLEFMTFEPNQIEGDFDINVFSDQMILKDYLQIRVIEEITEATMDIENWNHFKEEIADAFNFLISAYAIYGFKFQDLPTYRKVIEYQPQSVLRDHSSKYFSPKLREMCYDVVEQIGRACNLLKNRPWKQTQFLVDINAFEEEFKKILTAFYCLCDFCQISMKELFETWSLKFQVNQFRITTMY